MSETAPDQWILIRGLARESAHWGQFTSQLQQVFPASQVTCLDLPGTGKALQSTSPWSIAKITDWVREQASLSAGSRCGLIGLSLGGMVVWDWLKRYPQDASLGVLLNTSFADLSPFYDRLNWKQYPKIFRLAFKRDMRQREKQIIQMVCNRSNQSPILESWLEIQQQRPVTSSTIFRQLIASAIYRSANKPHQPTFVIGSKADKLVSPRCSTRIHQHHHLPIAEHEWAGHDITTDDGEWVAEQIRRLISDLDQQWQ